MRKDGQSFEQWLKVIRRRWWIVVICGVISGVAAFAFSAFQHKKYTASASLLFEDPGFDQMIFGTSLFTPSQDPAQLAATDIDLVSLPTVSQRSSEALHGAVSPSRIRDEVTVSPAGQSNVANISVTDTNPVRAARIANTYATQFIRYRQSADRAKIAGALSTIQHQLNQVSATGKNNPAQQSLLNRANQLRILSALQTGNAELVQSATVPYSPSSPHTNRNAVLGGFLGLLFGFGVVFLLERLDRRLREPGELEEAYGVPVLGDVPESAVYSLTPPRSLPAAEAEAFALLRARLRYFNVDREVRTILVTSAMPGEGKSTVALNLALADAASEGSNVILVEADLRRPTLARGLGLAAGPGLAEVLSRSVSTAEAVQEFSVPGRSNGASPSVKVAVITAGLIPPNPAELIESRAMTDLLSALAELYDQVIIDSPPSSAVSDAIPLVRQVSGVVVVSRIGFTTRDAARHLRDQLVNLGAPTLGVVANAVPSKGRRSYRYAYGYADAYERQASSSQRSVEQTLSQAGFDSETGFKS
jgi:tyrosine-protein kinase